MQYPKISLVTACFNHKDYIAETIESIVSQGYPNLEYIVIDDGSTDGSWEIIQKYKHKLYLCERLEGYRDTVTIALNYGIKKTSGNIMGWLNSDDILLPKSLFSIAKIFGDNPKVEWFTGMASTINQRGELVNSILRLKSKNDFLIGEWKVIQQESTFWRRGLWEKSGGALNEAQKWAFDTELWTKFG
jgi:glycosyltransferase involved in cell wall biosynthesis